MSKKVIQVPLEDELLAALDLRSRAEGRSRAELIREACRSYLWRREQEELDRVYVEGYRRIPDDGTAAKAQLAMLPHILEPEAW